VIPLHRSSWPARVGLGLVGVLAATARRHGAVVRAGDPAPAGLAARSTRCSLASAGGWS